MDSSIEAAALSGGGGSEQLAGQLYVAAMLASMKTEFPPGPPLVYGHGFGPPIPGLVLDLSSTATASTATNLQRNLLAATDQSHTPVMVDEENVETLPAVRIKREIKTESMEDSVDQEEEEESGSETDAAVENDEGCSRTLPRMPQAWRQKQREQVQVIQPQQQQQQIAMTLTTAALPLPPPPADPGAASAAATNKRKALIHPQQRNPSSPITTAVASASSVPSTIPVGIAVARQRAAESSSTSSRHCSSKTGRSTPLQPKALRLPIPIDTSSEPANPSTSQSFMSSVNPLLSTGLNYGLSPAASSRLYNPSSLYGSLSWPTPWSPASTSTAVDPHYSAASLWPHPPPPTDLNSIMGPYSAYAATNGAPSGAVVGNSSILHHHLHHAATTPGGLTSGPPPPYLLIPTACLDPYQRAAAAAAMLWPGYAAPPPQSPWNLAAEMANIQSHQQSSPSSSSSMMDWSHSLHSGFELPTLRAATAVATNDAPIQSITNSNLDYSRNCDQEAGREVKPVIANCINIKEERGTSPEPATICHSASTIEKETKPLDVTVSAEPTTTTTTTPIRIKEDMMSPESSPVPPPPPPLQLIETPASAPLLDDDSNYSGLQLLSDSIERFMATSLTSECERGDVISSRDVPHIACSSSSSSNSNALDVLCAAALYQQVQQASSLAAPTSEESFVPASASCSSNVAISPDQRPPPQGFQLEFDFRSKLAELQRKYKEKQKELSSLRVKRKENKSEHKEKKKRRRSSSDRDSSKRRKSCSSNSSRDGPVKKKHDEHQQPQQQQATETMDNHASTTTSTSSSNSHADFIVPGRLDLQPTSLRHRSTDEPVVELVPRVAISYAAALASAAVVAAATSSQGDEQTSSSSVTSIISSVCSEKKKRKPDFPVRKQETELTETIVPSKKRKLYQLFQWCHSSNDISSTGDHRPDSPLPAAKKTNGSLNKKKNCTATSGGSRKNASSASSACASRPKIKPKLKAEVQVKRISSASSCSEEGSSNEEDQYEESHRIKVEVKEEEEEEVEEESENQRLERHCLPALQLLQLSDDSGAEVDVVPSPSPIPAVHSPPPPPTPPASDGQDPVTSSTQISEPVFDIDKQSQWQLSQDLLSDGLRVLIAEEGLFRGGAVQAIRPPDIYGVLVDGERGSRPRILSTEELLHEALLEVQPISLAELPIGTRICAYWSRKSRCLYPGAVVNLHPAAKPTGHRCPVREDEIDVEFDDGDRGRITLSQTRLLPPDYPVLERNMSPLLPLESRRNKRRSSDAVTPVPPVLKQSSTEEKEEVVIKIELEESKQDQVINTNMPPKSKKIKKPKKKTIKKIKRELTEAQDQQEDLIIPVSPGLAIEPALDYAIKRETRASSTPTPTPPPPPIARKTTPKSKPPMEQPRHHCAKSKIAAFLPDRQLWEWMGSSFKKASKGKGRKEFYKAIQRGDEIIRVGDCAVFLSAGRPDRPYVGRIELLWQSWGGSMTVKVRWFYHPEETCGGRRLNHLKIAGALFESNHVDENDVQTISHCCTVSALDEYRLIRSKTDVNLNVDGDSIGSGFDQFYLAGFYDPTSGHLSFEPGVLEQ